MAGKKIYLSADDFLKGLTIEPVDHEVPGLGWVQVRALATLEAERISADRDGKAASGIEMAMRATKLCLVRPELPESAIDAMRNGNAGVVMSIGRRIMQLSGMGNQAEMEALEGEVGPGSPVENHQAPQT